MLYEVCVVLYLAGDLGGAESLRLGGIPLGSIALTAL